MVVLSWCRLLYAEVGCEGKGNRYTHARRGIPRYLTSSHIFGFLKEAPRLNQKHAKLLPLFV